jgi:iron(III) transport system permease protein
MMTEHKQSSQSRHWRTLLLLTSGLCLFAAVVLANAQERSLLWSSLRLVLFVECLTLPISFLLAFFLARTDGSTRRVIWWLLTSLLFMPLYLQLTGWDAALGKLGWWTLWCGRSVPPLLQGFRAVVLLHTIYAIPWASLLMAAQFRVGQRVWEEQALLEGTPHQVFRRITWPQCRGGVWLAAVWIMLLTIGEMTVTNIYLVRTYTENVYSHFAASGDLSSIVPHAIPLVCTTLALLLVAFVGLQDLPMPRAMHDPYRWPLGAWRKVISAALLSFVLLLCLFPLLNLLLQAGMKVERLENEPVRRWSAQKVLEIMWLTPVKFFPEMCNSLLLATIATCCSIVLGSLLAWWGRRSELISGSAWFACSWGLAMPAPLIGAGVVWLMNQPHVPLLIYLYDRTLLPPLLAILVKTLPIAFLGFHWGWRTLDPYVLEAASLEGANDWQQLLRMAFPQRWPTVLACGLVVFATAFGELAASLLTLPPGWFTVPQRMFGLVHSGVDDQVAGLGLWLWLLCLVAGGIFRSLPCLDPPKRVREGV